uniref:Uncharacterized protein n=1 Tax=Chromera velia CCMP2878 TaxID=1169474 RepID=A0A0K6SBF3_9ALVE|eukprot:Cvel_119.t3-p1 / transcript=Cvel_119.t3 / gene=Cvel_119 / organism=Chromera_velia_CCMP2878 / gene_product=hypothetical protein / transcript_product=hypothetical protein / location=Cvel_scaffold8:223178-224371(+) / protein_length=169 / sequence_SO=supercontig / SO=protein_coding / is_pseudo=false
MEVRKHIRCIMPRTEEEQRKAVVKWATITLQDEEKTEEEKKEAKEALQRVGEKVPGEEREEQTGRGAKRERVQTLQSKDRPRERRCGKRGGGGGCRHAGNEEGGEGKDRPPPKDRKGHTEEEERRKRIELMDTVEEMEAEGNSRSEENPQQENGARLGHVTEARARWQG